MVDFVNQSCLLQRCPLSPLPGTKTTLFSYPKALQGHLAILINPFLSSFGCSFFATGLFWTEQDEEGTLVKFGSGSNKMTKPSYCQDIIRRQEDVLVVKWACLQSQELKQELVHPRVLGLLRNGLSLFQICLSVDFTSLRSLEYLYDAQIHSLILFSRGFH